MLTVSIASPAFFRSRALTLAVVDRTAVATFATTSFLRGFVDGGYANKLGRAFEMKSIFGIYAKKLEQSRDTGLILSIPEGFHPIR